MLTVLASDPGDERCRHKAHESTARPADTAADTLGCPHATSGDRCRPDPRPRTGIGNAVAWTFDALADRDDLALRPYVTSARARLRPPERRLPLPAAAGASPLGAPIGADGSMAGTSRRRPRHELRGPADTLSAGRVGLRLLVPRPPRACRPRRPARRQPCCDGRSPTAPTSSRARMRPLAGSASCSTPIGSARSCSALRPPTRSRRTDAPSGSPISIKFVLALGTIERRKNLPTLIAASAASPASTRRSAS